MVLTLFLAYAMAGGAPRQAVAASVCAVAVYAVAACAVAACAVTACAAFGGKGTRGTIRGGGPTRGGPARSGLESEYQNWLISRLLLLTGCRTAHTRCRMAIESWMLGTIPEDAVDFTARGGVLRHALQDKRYIMVVLGALDPELVAPMAQVVDELALALETGVWPSADFDNLTHQIIEDGSTIRYGSYEVVKTERITELCRLGDMPQLLTMLLRYSTLLAAANHWAVPMKVFEVMWACGVRNEAFASPLNALTLGRAGGGYYTRFPDTDAPFGSVGNWLLTPLPALLGRAGAWEINPPFTKRLIIRASKRAAELAAAGRDIIFITRASDPGIARPNYHKIFRACKASARCLVPYETQTPRGIELRWPTFSTLVIYAGPLDMAAAEALVSRITRAWGAIIRPA
jgi:hypothetical protein